MTTEVAPPIQTKWGTAKVWNTGYYTISDNTKGHYKKLLHRLIFEEFYQSTLPEDWIIHHDDENKLNNEIWNLVPMTRKEHAAYHNSGEKCHFYGVSKTGKNSPRYGKLLSEEAKLKISQSKIGVKLPKSTGINMSKNKNTSGFYCVSTKPCPKCNIGFSWIYQYYDETFKKKVIHSVDLLKLKRKVLDRNLLWKVMDINNAKLTAEKYGYNLEDLM